MRHVVRPALALLLVVALFAPAGARADGLKLSLGFQSLRFPGTEKSPEGVDFYMFSLGARVSRGRAGLSFTVPYDAISGGSVGVSPDGIIAGSGGAKGTRWGLGDMGVSLDYNLIQNRQRMIIVTANAGLYFPTGAPGLTGGEHYLLAGLSGVYGITRQLLAYADVHQGFVGILTPVARRTTTGEAGVVYWISEQLGVTAGLRGMHYPTDGGGNMLELTGGLMYELLPGTMVSLGGLGGLAGKGTPTGGGNLGVGFEL